MALLVSGLSLLPRAAAVADEPEDAPPAAPAQPRPPAQPAADDEAPAAQARVYGDNRHVASPGTPKAAARGDGDGRARAAATETPRPTIGLGIDAGVAYGGDALVEATFDTGQMRGIRAGSGLFVMLTAHWTPFWFNDTAGLGVAVSGGGKFDEVGASNGSVVFQRFPLAASLQLLVPVVDRWVMLMRGGVVKEIGGKLQGDGIAAGLDVDFPSKLGGFGDWGFYRAIGRQGGLVILFRYTKVGYTVGGADVDGSSIALAIGWHFLR